VRFSSSAAGSLSLPSTSTAPTFTRSLRMQRKGIQNCGPKALRICGSSELISAAREERRHRLRPSSTLLRIAHRLLERLTGPVLDAPCGYGRNARLMAALGFSVVCLDIAPERLSATRDPDYRLWVPSSSHLPWAVVPGKLEPMRADLLKGTLPFMSQSFAGVLTVHFTEPQLLGEFERVLMPGGFLFLETPGAQGRNYRELPAPGEIRRVLPSSLSLDWYREQRVGPTTANAVTVKLLAAKV
jgi:SAM-dependent methyltransferase